MAGDVACTISWKRRPRGPAQSQFGLGSRQQHIILTLRLSIFGWGPGFKPRASQRRPRDGDRGCALNVLRIIVTFATKTD